MQGEGATLSRLGQVRRVNVLKSQVNVMLVGCCCCLAPLNFTVASIEAEDPNIQASSPRRCNFVSLPCALPDASRRVISQERSLIDPEPEPEPLRLGLGTYSESTLLAELSARTFVPMYQPLHGRVDRETVVVILTRCAMKRRRLTHLH